MMNDDVARRLRAQKEEIERQAMGALCDYFTSKESRRRLMEVMAPKATFERWWAFELALEPNPLL
jgi:hypothetical protein